VETEIKKVFKKSSHTHTHTKKNIKSRAEMNVRNQTENEKTYTTEKRNHNVVFVISFIFFL
jgi:hypothetical protein